MGGTGSVRIPEEGKGKERIYISFEIEQNSFRISQYLKQTSEVFRDGNIKKMSKKIPQFDYFHELLPCVFKANAVLTSSNI